MLKQGHWLSALCRTSLSAIPTSSTTARQQLSSTSRHKRARSAVAAAALGSDNEPPASRSRSRSRRAGSSQPKPAGRPALGGGQQDEQRAAVVPAGGGGTPVAPPSSLQRQQSRGLHNASAAAAAAGEQGPASPVPLSQRVPVPPRDQPQWPDSPFTLRPYQREAIAHVITAWKAGSSTQMVMLPTGTGKTLLFSALARFLSQHYEPPTGAAASPASSPQPPAAGLGGSGLQRGDATVAAVSAGGSSSSSPEDSAAGAGAGGGARAAKKGRKKGSTGSARAAGTSSTTSTSSSSADMAAAATESSSTISSRLQMLQDTLGTAGAPLVPPSRRLVDIMAHDSPDSTASSAHTSSSEDSSSSRAGSTSSSPGPGPGRGSKQKQRSELVAPPGAMRVLVLAHRHELLLQAEEKFRLMWGSQDLTVSWVKGQRKEFGGQVVVASVATAVNCIPQLKACNFSLVIVDEAHHTVASTYKTLLEGLGFIREVPPPPAEPAAAGGGMPDSSPGFAAAASSSSFEDDDDGDVSNNSSSSSSRAGSPGTAAAPVQPTIEAVPNQHQLLLGVTATPYRLKKKESRELYDVFMPSFVRTIPQMINAGYLCSVKSQKILTTTDLKGALVGSTGDFKPSKLSLLVNSRSRNRLVLEAYLEACTEAQTADSASTDAELQLQQRRQQQHEQHAKARAAAVRAAMDAKERRKAAKREQALQELQLDPQQLQWLQQLQQASSGSSSNRSGGSEDDDEEEGEDGDEAAEMWPLPAGVSPESLTGGLSISGRRPVRKTIGFAVDIKHAEALSAVFNAAGVRASAIHSLMPFEVCRGELSRFRRGDVDVLFNVEVLTEGFDEPEINAILMARPTQSVGLYTQMLGRGLRIAPNKKECLVLDFTDKYMQAGQVVDMRVMLPDLQGYGPLGKPPDKGPSRIEEGAQGGEVDVLERAVQAMDIAWQEQGPHCVASMFDKGSVWLVAVGGMGPSQRAMLGLSDAEAGAATAAGAAAGAEEDEEDGGDGSMLDADLQDRYVVLHQQNKTNDASQWRVAFMPEGHSWKGLTKQDAFGAALDYIEAVVRQEQVRVVRRGQAALRRGGKPTFYTPKIDSFKQNAAWRSKPASDSQLAKLKQLEIPVPPGRLTKGEASDLISGHFTALASQEQLELLQAAMAAARFADLPVPLLKAHAAEVLAHVL